MKCKPTIASFSAARRFLPRFFPTPAVSSRSTRFRWRSRAGLIRIAGEVRSFNNHSGEGSKLVISVFARELSPPETPVWVNEVELTGTLCKSPNRRTTPMGREICDLMLAVNRLYGRSDYLPCIVWGQNARRAALCGAVHTLSI